MLALSALCLVLQADDIALTNLTIKVLAQPTLAAHIHDRYLDGPSRLRILVNFRPKPEKLVIKGKTVSIVSLDRKLAVNAIDMVVVGRVDPRKATLSGSLKAEGLSWKAWYRKEGNFWKLGSFDLWER